MELFNSFELVCKTDNKTYSFSLETGCMLLTDTSSGITIKLPAGLRPAPYRMTRLPFLPVVLTVHMDKKLVFRLTDEQVQAITLWHGPLTKLDLAQLQRERYKWLLPIAIVLMAMSLPVLKDNSGPAHKSISGYMNLGLGLFLLAIYIFSSVTLSRFVFLTDFLWFVMAGIVVAVDVMLAGRYISLILLPLLLIGAWSGIYEFRRFKGIK